MAQQPGAPDGVRRWSTWTDEPTTGPTTITTPWLEIGDLTERDVLALSLTGDLALGQFGDFETALYFSGVTFTSLGFGDITLMGTARLLAPLQAANGLMMFGFSTAVLINALQESPSRHGPR